MNCLNCQKPTNNPKFCSRSCSATFTNHTTPKRRKIQKYCKICGTPIKNRRRVCTKCNKNIVDWSTITLESMNNKRQYQINSRIRELARNQYFKEHKNYSCKICGYDKHIEIHHIKPITSFPKTTPISIINDNSNLIALCPNHHWELDNNIITI
jgi:predicted nucleic acid-binding Zn ribbon protein